MPNDDLYETLASELTARPGVERSTMMGFPCLRADGAFFASLDHRSRELVVKLPAARVAELVDSGRGKSFAPSGRTFREWVVVAGASRDEWEPLLEEAHAFATRKS